MLRTIDPRIPILQVKRQKARNRTLLLGALTALLWAGTLKPEVMEVLTPAAAFATAVLTLATVGAIAAYHRHQLLIDQLRLQPSPA